MNEDIKALIQEWFADTRVNGRVEVAKLYAQILLEVEKQLEFCMSDGDKDEQN